MLIDIYVYAFILAYIFLLQMLYKFIPGYVRLELNCTKLSESHLFLNYCYTSLGRIEIKLHTTLIRVSCI